MPVPRPRLFVLTLVALLPAAFGAVSPGFVALAAVALTVVAALAVADLRAAPALGPGDVTRIAEPQLSVGAPSRVRLVVRNPLGRAL
ncbi:MAG: DUF58 domain-containing protein, partial [Candidatus Limnocylindria bacterium]|nr:DUF58 domain-containing protein [Candidatus Limnocylindria bacterium]